MKKLIIPFGIIFFGFLTIASCTDKNDEPDSPEFIIIDPNDEEAISASTVSAYYGHWIDSNKEIILSLNSDKSFVKYNLNNQNKRYYDSKKIGTWNYNGTLKFLILSSTNYSVNRLTQNTLTITSQNDGELMLTRISENQVPIEFKNSSDTNSKNSKKLIGNWRCSKKDIGFFSNGEMYMMGADGTSSYKDGKNLSVYNYKVDDNQILLYEPGKSKLYSEYDFQFSNNDQCLTLLDGDRVIFELNNVNHEDKATFDYKTAPFSNYMYVNGIYYEIVKIQSSVHHATGSGDSNNKTFIFFGPNGLIKPTGFYIIYSTPYYDGIDDWYTGSYTVTDGTGFYKYIGVGSWSGNDFKSDGTFSIKRSGNITTYDYNGSYGMYSTCKIHAASKRN